MNLELRCAFCVCCALGALLSCTKQEPRHAPSAAPSQAVEAREPWPAPGDESPINGTSAHPPMQLTQQDGEAIRAALVAWLKQSQLGDRDQLLALTEHAAIWEGADALLNIGRWALFADDGRLTAKLRLTAAGGEGMAFDASIAKEGDVWKVREVTPVHVHARR